MVDNREKCVTEVVGAADVFALLSIAFTYPDEGFAEALADGSFAHDLRASLADAGILDDEAEGACADIEAFAQRRDVKAVLEEARIDYTGLYYGPGKFRKMYPYESVFRKKLIDPEGEATAFMTRATHDVEKSLSRFGILPVDARTEPADHFAIELDLVRLLLTNYATALAQGDDGREWLAELHPFFSEHVALWVPSCSGEPQNRRIRQSTAPWLALAFVQPICWKGFYRVSSNRPWSSSVSARRVRSPVHGLRSSSRLPLA